MKSIEGKIASIKEDRRADYLFDTKVIADHLRVHPNKFHARWYRTRDWLKQIYEIQPGELAAEFMAIIAEGEQQRQNDSTRR